MGNYSVENEINRVETYELAKSITGKIQKKLFNVIPTIIFIQNQKFT